MIKRFGLQLSSAAAIMQGMMYKNRTIEARLRQMASFFKVVLVLGARQTGKTSLLQNVFPDSRCITFDPVLDLYDARRDPDMFLDNFPSPVILDEVQYAPELLAAVKRRVDLSSAPGQYLMTGSQNLNVLRQVSESMAGRVGILFLDGMTPAEQIGMGTEGDGWLELWLKNRTINPATVKTIPATDGGLARMLWRGMLPGVLEAPDALVSSYFASYVETYVQRDMRTIGDVSNLTEFGRFLRLAAALTSAEVNLSKLGRDVGVHPKTARYWLDLLKHGFQWREFSAYHGNAIKRISGKSKGFLTDTGLCSFLMGLSSPHALYADPRYGAVFETWVMGHVARRVDVMGVPANLHHWRTTGGAEVDVVIDHDGWLFPIEAKCKTSLTRYDVRGLQSFRATYGSRVAAGILVYAGDFAQKIADNVFAVPWNAF